MQALVYELLAFTGPVWSALVAGFVTWDCFGKLFLTPDGEHYLAKQEK